MSLLAISLYHADPGNGRVILHAMPVMILVLVCLALAYRFYSAFLAAKVAALDDSRQTPAHRLHDGQNYHPTNKWVLFGHHFAAISGAGPLIGPVLAIQYGYAPGLIWLVIGVCLAGAVQDMLVLAASVRRDGKSLAEIARAELGPAASVVASLAILFIVIIALAGLGFVVVKALGGEEVKLPEGMTITYPTAAAPDGQVALPAGMEFVPGTPAGDPSFVGWARVKPASGAIIEYPVGQRNGSVVVTARDIESNLTSQVYSFPAGCRVRYAQGQPESLRTEAFNVRVPNTGDGLRNAGETGVTLPAGCTQVIAGSSWGTFTIAATIPIALLVGLWMYRIRPGKVVEASLIGGALTLFAVVAGGWVPGSPLEKVFSLTKEQTIWTLCIYGFVAAVLPVWLLLGPRDYLSSFLKIGTVGLLIVGVIVANPTLEAPPLNEVFVNGGPTFEGGIFPFVFICVMCGAISGFHSLVSSGTTPKMVDKETHVRPIGYGAMLMEGLVGTVALIAAASLPSDLYYDINVPIDKAPQFQKGVDEVQAKYGVSRATLPPESRDPAHATQVDSPQHLNLGQVEEMVGGESLRGRTGGAVTLAVGMAMIFQQAFAFTGIAVGTLLKYWYHFAIMFEALFILTTIDAGTRIARFLLQETAGRVYKPLARPDWLPGALLASGIVTAGYGWFISTGSITTIWPMFGIANQLLAVMALALVTTWMVNQGRGRYAWVTVLPMLFVTTTTLTAGSAVVQGQLAKGSTVGYVNAGLTIFVIACVCTVLLWAVARCASVLMGKGKV